MVSTDGNRIHPLLRLALLLALLYLFFVSISLLGASFKFFGKGFAERLLSTTANPFVGLFIGVLATSLVQSSSSTTSITVGLVAGGALDVTRAIPIIMGANMGTSVTNTLVSIGHISRPHEFKRAFAAATVHDFFNLIAVVVIFPLQLGTNVLGGAATGLTRLFGGVGGMEFANPLKMMVTPAVKQITHLTSESGTVMLLIAVILLFVALRYIVVNLRKLVIGKIETFFNTTLFKNAARAMVLGLVITVSVQSSSITTSLAVPLAGAGILTLAQIFPFTLGANVGTTVTAILASLVTGDPAAVTVAFAHLLFNIFGIVLIWPIRRVPIFLANTLAEWSIRSRLVPLVYIGVVFFVVPLILIYFVG
ncbi:MAG: Na/Pi symporter [Candidatus Krumholzibacteria bacterium]|nr:Na/Pi symporter [Candidatus Krumholzibacteria bacterium]